MKGRIREKEKSEEKKRHLEKPEKKKRTQKNGNCGAVMDKDEKGFVRKGKTYFNYWTIYGASYERLAMVLAGTAILTAGNVYLRWSIGEALDTGKLQMSLLMIAGVLLVLSQLISYIWQILFVKVQKNLYGKIQAKVLNSSMESLGKSGQGAVTAYYTSDVGQIDSFANRILGRAFPDLVGWLITVGMMFWFDGYLGIVAIFVTVVPALFLHRMSRPIAKGTGEYQEALEKVNQSVVNGLYNLGTIKASGQEGVFIRDNDEKMTDLQKKKRKVAIWEALLSAHAGQRLWNHHSADFFKRLVCAERTNHSRTQIIPDSVHGHCLPEESCGIKNQKTNGKQRDKEQLPRKFLRPSPVCHIQHGAYGYHCSHPLEAVYPHLRGGAAVLGRSDSGHPKATSYHSGTPGKPGGGSGAL